MSPWSDFANSIRAFAVAVPSLMSMRRYHPFVLLIMTAGGSALAAMAGRMEIALGPAVVRVGADVDAAALRRVLEVVRSLA